jgi:putative DNA methylase
MVRAQVKSRRGGADDARLYCTVVKNPAGDTDYRSPTESDAAAVRNARYIAENLQIAEESLPPDGALGFRVQKYGIVRWRDVFTARQIVTLRTFQQTIEGILIPTEIDEKRWVDGVLARKKSLGL